MRYGIPDLGCGMILTDLSLWILTGTNPFGFLPHSGTGMTKGGESTFIEFLSLPPKAQSNAIS